MTGHIKRSAKYPTQAPRPDSYQHQILHVLATCKRKNEHGEVGTEMLRASVKTIRLNKALPMNDVRFRTELYKLKDQGKVYTVNGIHFGLTGAHTEGDDPPDVSNRTKLDEASNPVDTLKEYIDRRINEKVNEAITSFLEQLRS